MKTKTLITLMLSAATYFTVGDPTGYSATSLNRDKISVKITIKNYLLAKEEALMYELNHKLNTFPILNKPKK